MPPLQYVGRTPDSDSTIAPKSYVDSQNSVIAVTTAYINAQIAAQTALLENQSYVDTQDALRAQKTAVDAADALYVPTTSLGAASGVASLDSSGDLTAAQVPSGTVTDRVATYYNAATSGQGQILLASGSTHTVTTTSPREFQLASITVADPGYPWRPIPFAVVCGGPTAGSNPGVRTAGNGNYGLLTVMPPSGVSDTIYGVGICSGAFALDFYTVLPSATANQTPTSVPAVTGSLELDLYGCCWSGSTFTYTGLNLAFYVLVLPAL